MARVSLQPTYILHTRAYRETSLIVDAFTPDYGRLSIMAKGVRRPKSASRGLLRSFQALLVSWTGNDEFPTLTDVELHGSYTPLQGNMMKCGMYLNELLTRLFPQHNPHPEVFDHYQNALGMLATGDSENRCLRLFEKHLLADLGYGLQLAEEVDSGLPVDNDARYHYEVERGPIRADNERHFEGSISGASLLSLAQERLDDEISLRECKQLMRRVLAFYLGDKPLQSRKLFRNLD
ncbi:MAG TPA: DNA repair protein RecO [Chromatiaceae bacterium]|jgi:DNA repair protein RecO (recombination protein O)|nr:DNA repair protein RecO [Chromatiaceae bacterium]HIA09325.1 DNA repair protein RecO [Chromatiaceae bacterium]HIN81383.1 DNA repair protein RecO [Chromatiales bacterium]HIO54124.1 DNA repair protein RecO [Chromatiales bacterium]